MTQRDYLGVLQSVTVMTLAVIGLVAIAKPVTWSPAGVEVNVGVPTGVTALFLLLSLALVGGVRFIGHAIAERPLRGFRARKGASRVLIVGAGDGGRLVLREIVRNPELGMSPVGFVDDDPRKRGVRIDGVKVLGATDELPRILDEVEPDEVHHRDPVRARARCARASCAPCRERGIPVRTLPTVFELLRRRRRRRPAGARGAVEDVLGREPVRMELDRVGAYLAGEVVLVTGAGGSIGSELCRQIARVAPAAAHPARPRRGQPLPDPARAARTTATSRSTSRRCSPTARRRSGCARCSPSTARRSSSTPPRTSTSA